MEILGVPVDVVDMPGALEQVRALFGKPGADAVLALNPEKVMAARRDRQLLCALRSATLVIPDGIGIVLASRMLGYTAMERVPGSDLMPEICRVVARKGYRVFLYGARPDIAIRAADILQRRYPGLEVAGARHGYLPEKRMPELVDDINAAGTDVVFVGLGSPRQEYWIQQYRHRLQVRLCQGVGGSFDTLCGYPRRAPRLMRAWNLEWLYRLVTQPRRAGRQLALPRFATRLMLEVISERPAIGP